MNWMPKIINQETVISVSYLIKFTIVIYLIKIIRIIFQKLHQEVQIFNNFSQMIFVMEVEKNYNFHFLKNFN